MQLTLGNRFATYTPPKSQLLKWVGNKQRFAAEITKFFPANYNKFYEPFIGSGAIIATVEPLLGVGSDNFSPLIEIWQKLKNDPKGLVYWYDERRSRLINEDKVEVYEDVKASFNKKHNGADFLFLTRSCYGGIVRFRKSDGYMSTPCGPHIPISTKNFEKRVQEWHHRLKNVEFILADYKEIFEVAQEGDLIYCDPPYSHSQGILYGAQTFKLENLFEQIKFAKEKGVYVALSIDGSKKSGNYICNLPIPDDIFEEEIYISTGSSMLKRFQMEGKTLEAEHVTDRLLLNYSLENYSSW